MICGDSAFVVVVCVGHEHCHVLIYDVDSLQQLLFVHALELQRRHG